MSIKLALDASALEKLFQNDPEGGVRLDLSNAVVQTFANKHLKAVVNSETFQEYMKEIYRMAGEMMLHELGIKKKSMYSRELELTEAAKNLLGEYVQRSVKKFLEDQVEEIVDRAIEAFEIDRYVQQAVAIYAGNKINTEINRRWAEVVEETKKNIAVPRDKK